MTDFRSDHTALRLDRLILELDSKIESGGVGVGLRLTAEPGLIRGLWDLHSGPIALSPRMALATRITCKRNILISSLSEGFVIDTLFSVGLADQRVGSEDVDDLRDP